MGKGRLHGGAAWEVSVLPPSEGIGEGTDTSGRFIPETTPRMRIAKLSKNAEAMPSGAN